MTNLAAFAHADAPLFLFHLLEFSGVDFDLDVDALNARWAEPRNIDAWGQLVMKHTRDSVELVPFACEENQARCSEQHPLRPASHGDLLKNGPFDQGIQ